MNQHGGSLKDGRSTVLGKVGRWGERTSDLWKVKGLLWRYLHVFTFGVCNPLVETFGSILNPEVAMIQIATVELIPEFLEELDTRLCLVALDFHPFEFVLTVYQAIHSRL